MFSRITSCQEGLRSRSVRQFADQKGGPRARPGVPAHQAVLQPCRRFPASAPGSACVKDSLPPQEEPWRGLAGNLSTIANGANASLAPAFRPI